MHCAQARNQIALLVGDDIADTERVEVEQHLSQCKSCCDYRSGMKDAHNVLQTFAAEDSGVVSAPSLWAEMQPAVRLESTRKAKRFNGWIAGLCVAALVMAMVAISGDLTSSGGVGFESEDPGFQATPVGNQTQPSTFPQQRQTDNSEANPPNQPEPFPGSLR